MVRYGETVPCRPGFGAGRTHNCPRRLDHSLASCVLHLNKYSPHCLLPTTFPQRKRPSIAEDKKTRRLIIAPRFCARTAFCAATWARIDGIRRTRIEVRYLLGDVRFDGVVVVKLVAGAGLRVKCNLYFPSTILDAVNQCPAIFRFSFRLRRSILIHSPRRARNSVATIASHCRRHVLHFTPIHARASLASPQPDKLNYMIVRKICLSPDSKDSERGAPSAARATSRALVPGQKRVSKSPLRDPAERFCRSQDMVVAFVRVCLGGLLSRLRSP